MLKSSNLQFSSYDEYVQRKNVVGLDLSKLTKLDQSDRKALGRSANALFNYLVKNCDVGKPRYFTRDYLAKKISKSERTTSRALTTLADAGIISRYVHRSMTQPEKDKPIRWISTLVICLKVRNKEILNKDAEFLYNEYYINKAPYAEWHLDRKIYHPGMGGKRKGAGRKRGYFKNKGKYEALIKRVLAGIKKWQNARDSKNLQTESEMARKDPDLLSSYAPKSDQRYHCQANNSVPSEHYYSNDNFKGKKGSQGKGISETPEKKLLPPPVLYVSVPKLQPEKDGGTVEPEKTQEEIDAGVRKTLKLIESITAEFRRTHKPAPPPEPVRLPNLPELSEPIKYIKYELIFIDANDPPYKRCLDLQKYYRSAMREFYPNFKPNYCWGVKPNGKLYNFLLKASDLLCKKVIDPKQWAEYSMKKSLKDGNSKPPSIFLTYNVNFIEKCYPFYHKQRIDYAASIGYTPRSLHRIGEQRYRRMEAINIATGKKRFRPPMEHWYVLLRTRELEDGYADPLERYPQPTEQEELFAGLPL